MVLFPVLVPDKRNVVPLLPDVLVRSFLTVIQLAQLPQLGALQDFFLSIGVGLECRDPRKLDVVKTQPVGNVAAGSTIMACI